MAVWYQRLSAGRSDGVGATPGSPPAFGEFTSCLIGRWAGSEAERDSVSAQEAAERRGSELR